MVLPTTPYQLYNATKAHDYNTAELHQSPGPSWWGTELLRSDFLLDAPPSEAQRSHFSAGLLPNIYDNIQTRVVLFIPQRIPLGVLLHDIVPLMASSSTSAPAAGNVKPTAIVCVGMAGSGKTTFMQRINAHLHSQKEPPYVINLDPAVLHVPFEANIDIRDSVNYKEVMKQYNLGPNGGILTSLNLFATKVDQIIGLLDKRASPEEGKQAIKNILVDTRKISAGNRALRSRLISVNTQLVKSKSSYGRRLAKSSSSRSPLRFLQ